MSPQGEDRWSIGLPPSGSDSVVFAGDPRAELRHELDTDLEQACSDTVSRIRTGAGNARVNRPHHPTDHSSEGRQP